MKLYSQILSPSGLERMTELELGQLVSSLWSYRGWGNKGYLVEKLIQDNGLEKLQDALHELLWGTGSIAERYNDFRSTVKWLGVSSITEILCFIFPDLCGIWNEKARTALDTLGIASTFPVLKKYQSQIQGEDYAQFNEVLRSIRDELRAHGVPAEDLLDVDFFLYEVRPTTKDLTTQEIQQSITVDVSPTITDFDHDAVRDQLQQIGSWLGFKAQTEKLVAKGAKVDVVWQAQIANLGVVSYAFEVQRRGSIDSLILNLQRAQNNPSVQRLIIVATESDLEKIKQEVSSLPEGFRKSLNFMPVTDVLRASKLVDELSAIIDKLQLVQSEFGV